MDAFVAEIKLMNQNMRSEFKQNIYELTEATAILSARIDGLDNRINDLRNDIYLGLVILGIIVTLPNIQKFFQQREAHKHSFSLDDVEKLVERIIDAKLNARSQ